MSSLDDIDQALDVLSFLSRSANRVRALDLLSDGPLDRRTMETELDISRPTLSRILEDFDAYGWAIRDGRRYEATQLGRYVNAEFRRIIDRFEPATRLREVARWFPASGFGFDLAALATAEIVQPSKEDAMATMSHIASRVENADRVRSLSYSMLPYEKVVEDGQAFEAIFEPAALAVMRDNPTMRAWAREMLASGGARICRYDATVPYVIVIADRRANLCLSDDDGSPRAVIETEDDRVLEWAEATFEHYRHEATPLTPEAFMG